MNKKIFSYLLAHYLLLTFISLLTYSLLTTHLYATTGASFLKIGIGARLIGTGSAFTAVADDVSAIHWNPAGLAQLEKREISAMHTEWLVDTRFDFVGFAFPLHPTPCSFRRKYNLSIPSRNRIKRRKPSANREIFCK